MKPSTKYHHPIETFRKSALVVIASVAFFYPPGFSFAVSSSCESLVQLFQEQKWGEQYSNEYPVLHVFNLDKKFQELSSRKNGIQNFHPLEILQSGRDRYLCFTRGAAFNRGCFVISTEKPLRGRAREIEVYSITGTKYQVRMKEIGNNRFQVVPIENFGVRKLDEEIKLNEALLRQDLQRTARLSALNVEQDAQLLAESLMRKQLAGSRIFETVDPKQMEALKASFLNDNLALVDTAKGNTPLSIKHLEDWNFSELNRRVAISHSQALSEDVLVAAGIVKGSKNRRVVVNGKSYVVDMSKVNTAMGSSEIISHAPANEVIPRLEKWLAEANSVNKQTPIEQVFLLYSEFIGIHPFIDGNGGTGRMVLDFLLLKGEYPLVKRSEVPELLQNFVSSREMAAGYAKQVFDLKSEANPYFERFKTNRPVSVEGKVDLALTEQTGARLRKSPVMETLSRAVGESLGNSSNDRSIVTMKLVDHYASLPIAKRIEAFDRFLRLGAVDVPENLKNTQIQISEKLHSSFLARTGISTEGLTENQIFGIYKMNLALFENKEAMAGGKFWFKNPLSVEYVRSAGRASGLTEKFIDAALDMGVVSPSGINSTSELLSKFSLAEQLSHRFASALQNTSSQRHFETTLIEYVDFLGKKFAFQAEVVPIESPTMATREVVIVRNLSSLGIPPEIARRFPDGIVVDPVGFLSKFPLSSKTPSLADLLSRLDPERSIGEAIEFLSRFDLRATGEITTGIYMNRIGADLARDLRSSPSERGSLGKEFATRYQDWVKKRLVTQIEDKVSPIEARVNFLQQDLKRVFQGVLEHPLAEIPSGLVPILRDSLEIAEGKGLEMEVFARDLRSTIVLGEKRRAFVDRFETALETAISKNPELAAYRGKGFEIFSVCAAGGLCGNSSLHLVKEGEESRALLAVARNRIRVQENHAQDRLWKTLERPADGSPSFHRKRIQEIETGQRKLLSEPFREVLEAADVFSSPKMQKREFDEIFQIRVPNEGSTVDLFRGDIQIRKQFINGVPHLEVKVNYMGFPRISKAREVAMREARKKGLLEDEVEKVGAAAFLRAQEIKTREEAIALTYFQHSLMETIERISKSDAALASVTLDAGYVQNPALAKLFSDSGFSSSGESRFWFSFDPRSGKQVERAAMDDRKFIDSAFEVSSRVGEPAPISQAPRQSGIPAHMAWINRNSESFFPESAESSRAVAHFQNRVREALDSSMEVPTEKEMAQLLRKISNEELSKLAPHKLQTAFGNSDKDVLARTVSQCILAK